MRLSLRLPDSLEENDLAAALRRRRASGLPVLDLTLSNPTTCGLEMPEHTLALALGNNELWRYNPDPQGARRAREAVAAYHGHDLSPQDVVLTASTSEAYAWIFKLLGNPGANVLVPTPSYPLFTWLARLEGMEARPVPAHWHEGWHLVPDALEQAWDEATVAVVVVNPNNPTGQYLSTSEWQALIAFCAQRNLALIVDEVFADFPLEAPEARLRTVLDAPGPPCPVFVLSGLSKIAALPQVKLGWILLLGSARETLPSLLFLADQYLSVSASAQALAPAALEQAASIQASLLTRLRRNLHTLDLALATHPHLSRLPVEGGWSALLRRPAVDEAEACALRLLEAHGVLVHPGPFFGLPGEGYMVVSLLPQPDVFQAGVAALLEGLSMEPTPEG